VLSPDHVAKVFDSAIAGIKDGEATEVQALPNLLISLGGALEDDTMVLVGVSLASTAGTFFQLKGLTMLDAEGIGKLLASVSKEVIKALKSLKTQLGSWEDRDLVKLVSALGILAKAYVRMLQKLTQLQQAGASGGGGGD
jgi:hypothetical protein